MIRPSYRANRVGNARHRRAAPAFFGMIFDPGGTKARTTRSTCAVAPGRAGASSAGRRSSISGRVHRRPGQPQPGGQAEQAHRRADLHAAVPPAAPDDRRRRPRRRHLASPAQPAAGDDVVAPSGQASPGGSGRKAHRRQRRVPEAAALVRPGAQPRRLHAAVALLPQRGLRPGRRWTHLGPVGGRIVGEVFIGLLELDQDSYLNARRRWRPTLPQRSGKVTGDFRMVDFLTFAGVAPDQRGRGGGCRITQPDSQAAGARAFLPRPGGHSWNDLNGMGPSGPAARTVVAARLRPFDSPSDRGPAQGGNMTAHDRHRIHAALAIAVVLAVGMLAETAGGRGTERGGGDRRGAAERRGRRSDGAHLGAAAGALADARAVPALDLQRVRSR